MWSLGTSKRLRVGPTGGIVIFAMSLVACGDQQVSQQPAKEKVDVAAEQSPAAPLNPAPPPPTKEPEAPPAAYNVHFDVNSAELSSPATESLNETLEYLRENPSMQVTLSGYTDALGPTDVNRQLAEARVARAARFFEENGIASTRIMTIAIGESASNVTPPGEDPQAWNRRVEVAISPSPNS